jgi:hypothetical protein
VELAPVTRQGSVPVNPDRRRHRRGGSHALSPHRRNAPARRRSCLLLSQAPWEGLTCPEPI